MIVLLKTAQVSEHEAETYILRTICGGQTYGLKEMPGPVFQKSFQLAGCALGPAEIVYEEQDGDWVMKLVTKKVAGSG